MCSEYMMKEIPYGNEEEDISLRLPCSKIARSPGTNLQGKIQPLPPWMKSVDNHKEYFWSGEVPNFASILLPLFDILCYYFPTVIYWCIIHYYNVRLRV